MSLPSVFSNDRFGVLKILSSFELGLYKFLNGLNQDGEQRQLVTRGPGKEKAATRIPIRLPAEMMAQLVSYAQCVGINMKTNGWCVFRDWLKTRSPNLEEMAVVLKQLTIPLIKMPRAGNLVSGLEWNAPGGTAEIGESFEQIAAREFDEEAAVAVVGAESPFPPGMLASGIYDEIQQISFALITGNPTKLAEGGKGWCEVRLIDFREWARNQNQQELPSRWHTSEYVPVDAKVVLGMWWLTQTTPLNDY